MVCDWIGRLYLKWQESDHLRLADVLEERAQQSMDHVLLDAWDLLHQILVYAQEHVPYYRSLFREKGLIVERDIQVPEDLSKVPLLTKRRIQENQDALISEETSASRLHQNTTGGSTGEPLIFYHDEGHRRHILAELIRCYRVAELDYGHERQTVVWGAPRDASPYKGPIGALRSFLTLTQFINTFSFSRKEVRQAIRSIGRFGAPQVVGYASSLDLLARTAEDEGQVGVMKPRAIQSTAETLMPPMRETIQRVFQCPVYNRFGCREAGNLAHECEAHEGLHKLLHVNYVEVVDPATGEPCQPGQMGRVVITTLYNKGMPLIRYETGDVAEAMESTPCSCGRGAPRIRDIHGRINDFLLSPSGRHIHAMFFVYLFYHVSGIKQYRVVQRTPQDLDIAIVKDRAFPEDLPDRIVKTIHEQADPEFRVTFRFPDEIPPTPSGKYRYVYSEVPAPETSPSDIVTAGGTRSD